MKKMRIMSLLIVAVMVLAMLGGCAKTELTYTVLEFGTSDGVDQGKHTQDIPEWSSEKVDPHADASAPAEISVAFNGVTYTGNYEWSETRMPNAFVSHIYKQKLENGDTVRFRIHAQTHELTFISINHKMEESASLEEAECRKIADAVADDYISLKDYKVKVDSNKDYDYRSYTYTYYREVSGYETTDRIRIVVKGNGVISSCDKSMVGTFKNVKRLAIDEEKATVAVSEKLKDIYGHLGTMTGYTIRSKEWVKTADDQCGWLYTVDVDLRDGNYLFRSMIKLLLV